MYDPSVPKYDAVVSRVSVCRARGHRMAKSSSDLLVELHEKLRLAEASAALLASTSGMLRNKTPGRAYALISGDAQRVKDMVLPSWSRGTAIPSKSEIQAVGSAIAEVISQRSVVIKPILEPLQAAMKIANELVELLP